MVSPGCSIQRECNRRPAKQYSCEARLDVVKPGCLLTPTRGHDCLAAGTVVAKDLQRRLITLVRAPALVDKDQETMTEQEPETGSVEVSGGKLEQPTPADHPAARLIDTLATHLFLVIVG